MICRITHLVFHESGPYNFQQLVLSFLAILLFSSCNSINSSSEDSLASIPYAPTAYDLNVPKFLGSMDLPKDNPLTVEGVALGRRLFYDPILSADSTMSCATCHIASANFTDRQAFSKGVDGKNGKRSAMSLLNVGFYNKGLFWDGRAKTLEEQALIPVEDPIELHESWPNVERKLREHAKYPTHFRKAFGILQKQEITKEMTVKAIAQFERTLISRGDSRFDRFRKGEIELTPDEQMGYDLFFDISPEIKDAECGNCHNEPLFTDNNYVNNGLDETKDLTQFADLGRGAVTNSIYKNGTFRVPSLRNIELTAPYMHDGRFKTLEEVIEHYDRGGEPAMNVHSLIRPLNLTNQEKKQLLVFLKTLTDNTFVNNPAYQSPF